MIPELRQKKIIDMISDTDIITTETLTKLLNISPSTLRRDLLKLSKQEKIVLLHGGGIRLLPKITELSMTAKMGLHKDAKDKIAQKAVSLIEDGDVIYLDPSSTTYQMIPYLKEHRVTVITNSVSHIDELIYYKIPCIMVGGSIKAATNSCIGLIAENILKGFNFNKCFIGANGFSITSGITNHDINENVIKTLAVRQSCDPYFLMDSSKFNVVAMVKLANISDYPIITEKIIPELSSYPNIIYSNN
ncbi:MAG: DeoR/GlpR family DNA-binding transcription regulator [Clostridiales bacterium]|nr:DeoR/GlpR transcriptional regulator [Clostridiales bacterium]MDU3240517.1 DeoR/GlpR family DNA-binding transcription regulator [Clostridiales bacterium]